MTSPQKPGLTKNTCGTCRWFQPDGEYGGLCVRYPPQLFPFTNANDDYSVEAHRPWMDVKDTCGEWVSSGRASLSASPDDQMEDGGRG